MYNCQQLVRCWYWSNILSPRSYAFANVMLTILCQTMRWASVNPKLFMKSIQHDLTEMAIRKSEVWFIKFNAPGFVLLLIVVYTTGSRIFYSFTKKRLLFRWSNINVTLTTLIQSDYIRSAPPSLFFRRPLAIGYSIRLLIWERCLFKNECKF